MYHTGGELIGVLFYFILFLFGKQGHERSGLPRLPSGSKEDFRRECRQPNALDLPSRIASYLLFVS
jgi:hypothetical protein